MRRYYMDELLNFRDLGGYPLGGKGYTKTGAFLRSAAPMKLSERDKAFCRELHVTTVVDLRGGTELEQYPCAFALMEGITYCHQPIIGGQQALVGEDDVARLYMGIADNHAAMQTVMQALAAAKGAALFHCTAGKDRTGVTAAILLLLAGVEDMDIVADYQVSDTYIAPMLKGMFDDNPRLPYFMGQSKPDYMYGFLRMFREKYRRAEDYLAQIGLAEAEIQALYHKLV